MDSDGEELPFINQIFGLIHRFFTREKRCNNKFCVYTSFGIKIFYFIVKLDLIFKLTYT
jgi:hypothetical protein